MKQLCDEGFEVLIETGGSLSIKDIDPRVKIIMDLKCPSSGMEKKNLYENIDYLKPNDEIKFVIGSREDYEWTKEMISNYSLNNKCEILFSVVFGKLEPVELVNWILEDKLNVRFQLQMHKFIWHPETKGLAIVVFVHRRSLFNQDPINEIIIENSKRIPLGNGTQASRTFWFM